MSRKPKPPPTVTASALIALLATRHRDDVFVPECKDGPSQFHSHLRLDAWAMKRSWANPLTIGYEVKVSRSDFMGDDKWYGYLPYCNEFYFVCPPGLIAVEELPESVGLIWSSSTGSRLYTKRKAPRREVDIPEPLYRYILMCRATVEGRERCRFETRQYWEEWLATRADNREFGLGLRGKLRRLVDEKITKVAAENDALKRRNAEFDDIRRTLGRLGIDFGDGLSQWRVEQRLRELQQAIPPGLMRALKDAQEAMETFCEKLVEVSAKEAQADA